MKPIQKRQIEELKKGEIVFEKTPTWRYIAIVLGKSKESDVYGHHYKKTLRFRLIKDPEGVKFDLMKRGNYLGYNKYYNQQYQVYNLEHPLKKIPKTEELFVLFRKIIMIENLNERRPLI